MSTLLSMMLSVNLYWFSFSSCGFDLRLCSCINLVAAYLKTGCTEQPLTRTHVHPPNVCFFLLIIFYAYNKYVVKSGIEMMYEFSVKCKPQKVVLNMFEMKQVKAKHAPCRVLCSLSTTLESILKHGGFLRNVFFFLIFSSFHKKTSYSYISQR